MNRQTRLKYLLSEQVQDVPLIDIGTTFMTGLHGRAKESEHIQTTSADPVYNLLALSSEESWVLGSDFDRAGLLFPPPIPENGRFTDTFGIQWSNEDGEPSPMAHPLETADLAAVKKYPRPVWDQPIQSVESSMADPGIIVADAPCPGLLTLSLMLRSPWQFIQDVAESNPVASALLEWAAEAVLEAYASMLCRMTRQPDIVVYGDDLGTMDSMYFSPQDFKQYLLPHLRMLLEEIRRLTPAAVCFHSCGAIRPILPDIADLGIEIYNLDTTSKTMSVSDLRTALPSRAVLHGATDLCALGTAVVQGDKATTARLITHLARSAPAIAAPTDSLAVPEQVAAARSGAAFIRCIGKEGFDQLRRYGPVRKLIETAMTDIQTKED
jgi:hypothetical protein